MAILVLPVFSRIFQYLQYWYYQYFPESSSFCNTGITSIFQNLPVSAILVLPVFPRIFRYLQYSYQKYLFNRFALILSSYINSFESLDNMKQPAAILVLPVYYQNLPVSAILVHILVNTSIPVSPRIFQYLQY
jgi:hypothetical protein